MLILRSLLGTFLTLFGLWLIGLLFCIHLDLTILGLFVVPLAIGVVFLVALTILGAGLELIDWQNRN